MSITIIKDCPRVFRAQVPAEVMERFLREDGEDVAAQMRTLCTPRAVVVSFKQKVRVRRLKGTGWYEISGYREDGRDTNRARSNLEASAAMIAHEAKMARKAKMQANTFAGESLAFA